MEQAAINEAPAPSCPIGVGPAMDYVKEVQNRFLPDRADVFQRFLSLLADYAKDPGLNKVPDVHRQVRELFAGEPDLVEGFEQFLPESMPKKGNKVVDIGKVNGNGNECEGHEEMAGEHEAGKEEGC